MTIDAALITGKLEELRAHVREIEQYIAELDQLRQNAVEQYTMAQGAIGAYEELLKTESHGV